MGNKQELPIILPDAPEVQEVVKFIKSKKGKEVMDIILSALHENKIEPDVGHIALCACAGMSAGNLAMDITQYNKILMGAWLIGAANDCSERS